MRRLCVDWLPQEAHFKRSLSSPMVFISGPRQVGKTYLSRSLHSRYFNWDTKEVKTAYLKNSLFFRDESQRDPWVVFDEIHKRSQWKSLLKGLYDSPQRKENYWVTGSGRFSLYQRGGDSLQGRYDLFHIYPLVPREIEGRWGSLQGEVDFRKWEPPLHPVNDNTLIDCGGFPAPFLAGNQRALHKWEDLYIDRLVREDIRDFSQVEKLDRVDLLARLLPQRVGSPLSVKGLSEDIECSQDSIVRWLRLFETLYLGFHLQPFHRRLERAVKQEKKFYFFPWTMVKERGSRFENYLAVQLLTVCRYWRDQGWGAFELAYLRDQDRREIDFVILKGLEPIVLVEAKVDPRAWPASLHYYADRLKIPAFLVYPKGPTQKIAPQKWSCSSAAFLHNLLATD